MGIVCEALGVISIVWEVPVALQWKYSVYLTGWVKFHLAASSILVFLAMFYKHLKRFGSHFLDWELVQAKKCQGHFFMTVIPFCFHCYVCSKSQALGDFVQPPSATTFAMARMEPMFQGRRPRNWSCKWWTLNSRLSKLFNWCLELYIYCTILLISWVFGKFQISKTSKTRIMIWVMIPLLLRSRTFT